MSYSPVVTESGAQPLFAVRETPRSNASIPHPLDSKPPIIAATVPVNRIGQQSCVIFTSNLDDDYGVPALPNGSVELVFTSPPYWNYMDYGEADGIGTEESYEQYIDSLCRVFTTLEPKVIPGGRVVVNICNMKSRRAVEGQAFLRPVAFDAVRAIMKAGFTFFDEIVWVKGGANAGALNGRPLFGSYPYPPTPKILDSIFENIFVFTKLGKRQAMERTIKDQSKLERDEWMQFTKGIWELPPDRDPHHPATFPIAMAERVIRLYSFKGDTVLDPFAGTGTTTIAAERLGRRGIGFEIEESYAEAVRYKTRKWLPLEQEYD